MNTEPTVEEVAQQVLAEVLKWHAEQGNQGLEVPLPVALHLATNIGIYRCADASKRPEARLKIIKSLWHAGLWKSPYIELVEAGAPGEPPTLEDIEQWIEESGDQAVIRLEHHQRWAQARWLLRSGEGGMSERDRFLLDFSFSHLGIDRKGLLSLLSSEELCRPEWVQVIELLEPEAYCDPQCAPKGD